MQETTVNPKHSSKSQEHYTPSIYLEAARRVLGHISLDPASCAIANQTVQANRFYTKEDDGLTKRWSGNIFINPPGGKIANKSLPKLFWDKLMAEVKEDYLNHAIFLAFSLEALQTCQKGVIAPMAGFPLCIPDRRISFVNLEGKSLTANTHASCFVYVPGLVDRTEYFCEVFRTFGSVLRPCL